MAPRRSLFVVDLFDEVEEQLRSERYKTMALKAAPYAVGALVLALAVALGIWGWTSYADRKANAQSEAYAAAVVERSTDPAKSEAAFRQIAKDGSKTYKALALMQLGGAALEKNDVKGAVALFDQAAETGAELTISDAARLKSAFALMDTASYAEIEPRLTVLAGNDRPYRSVAKEALAFAKLQKGDMAGARSDFNALALALESTESLQDRARKVVQLIDAGTATSMPAAAKAATVVPVSPVVPQFAPPGTAQ